MTERRAAGVPTSPARLLVLAGALLVAMSALTGCGSDEADPGRQTHTAANGDRFNDADVDFATAMIPHHAQATQLANLTIGRDLDPQVEELADAIRAAQVAEVETMVDWLTDWDEPVPATTQDHANAHGDGDPELDSDMPGMMTADELAGLEAAQGAEFEDLWLRSVIEHHEGAIEMAATEETDGEFAAAVEMARSIQSTQQAEIEQMQELLGS